MGQAGSQHAAAVPQRSRRAHTLPHEPLRHAPKVLPSLTESPRLRSTDNGAILHSGGTISGRRPGSALPESRTPNGHVHTNAYRSRSAGAAGDPVEYRARERDPLHRSHTNLDLRHNDGASINKRFGSEPDLRIEEEQQKPRCNNNKHFRKKYRAPPPPTHDNREGSSPDSSDGNHRAEPQKKLRLFKTRNETKKLNGHVEAKTSGYRSTYTDFKSLDLTDAAFERRYRSPCKDKEQHLKYPDSKDMVQSTASLKREEDLLVRQDYRKNRSGIGCRAKTSKTNEQSEAWKTPLLNRNFRYSERFKREEIETPVLRREKTFDNTISTSERVSDPSRSLHESRIKTIGEQLKASKLSPLAASSKPLRKSLPSLLVKNNEEKDEFQAELKKATSRIKHDIGNKVNNISENKTSQSDRKLQKPNPTKTVAQSKVKESSLKPSHVSSQQEAKVGISRRLPSRQNDAKNIKVTAQINGNAKNKEVNNKEKFNSKESGKCLPDRGQASGKESTPEHSPTRRKDSPTRRKNSPIRRKDSLTRRIDQKESYPVHDKLKSAPSKQFYFGMSEPKSPKPQEAMPSFPGLGAPVLHPLQDFTSIERKLLGYHQEDHEFDQFQRRLKEDCKMKNLSSESALSSGSSEGSCGSLGVSLRLRPTLPRRTPATPRFSPAAAWKQLASLDASLARETRPLAVETKVLGDITPESSPRSEPTIGVDKSADQCGDKSGDSGISGDHANSEHRIDSPQTPPEAPSATWTPQQDLGDSSSEGASPPRFSAPPAHTFSLSLPRDQDKGKQLQQGFNSLQKLRKSVSGALGAALGSRRFDLEHEPTLQEPEQNWFLTKSAPNSLSNPLLFPQTRVKGSTEDVIKEEVSTPPSDKEEGGTWRGGASYLSWGGHVMYLPPAQPLSLINIERPVRSKSSGSLEVAARAARAAALATEMRERERSASPHLARAQPARVEPATQRNSSSKSRGKRFTFQSTVRQLERRKIAEKLSKEADLKEQQRKTELEAMRRVEEEFQRKRAREKANIRQQLRLVSSGAASMPSTTNTSNSKIRDDPDGSCRMSPARERARTRASNASSDTSGRSKSNTPVRSVELSEWRTGTERCARVYRDWAGAALVHPPATAHMPLSPHPHSANGIETQAFSGSPVSDNYRREFARGAGRSPRTPRPPRLLPAPRSPSTSGSELSLRQPIKIREVPKGEPDLPEEPVIVPTLRPSGPARPTVLTH